MSNSVVTSVDGHRRLYDIVDRGSSRTVTALRTWASMYRAFAQARFDQMSAGGADAVGNIWPPLSPKTIEAKRRENKDLGILKRDLVLRSALEPLLPGPGSLEHIDGPFTITVGYGGADVYQPSHVPIAVVATAHQNGHITRGLPQRQVIVVPTQDVLDNMSVVMAEALQLEANDLIGT